MDGYNTKIQYNEDVNKNMLFNYILIQILKNHTELQGANNIDNP